MLFFFYLITACLAVPKDLVPQAKPKAEDLLAKIKTSNNDHMAKMLISSLTNADPAAVSHVKSLVEALIAAGEAERNAATTARDDAQTAFDTASSNLDTATEEHTTVAGQLSNAQDEVTRLTDLKAVHLTDQENAQDAFDAASTALDTAETWLSDETVRIDGEKATLEEIRSLLTGLLGTDSDHILDWRVYTDSTVRRDNGQNNCWDVNEIAFFSDILCSNPIGIASSARISSGSAGDRYTIDNAFDGSEVGSLWGGRSTDGNFGNSAVWIGVLGIANLNCIKLTQGESTSNNCRPSSAMLIQKRIPGTTNWITEKKIMWSTSYDGTHKFNIEEEEEEEEQQQYILGPKTGCDGGQIQISNPEDCQKAAETLGVRYWGGQGGASAADPTGCIYRTPDQDVYFNTHSTGSLNRNDRKLVCTSA